MVEQLTGAVTGEVVGRGPAGEVSPEWADLVPDIPAAKFYGSVCSMLLNR